MPGPEDKKPQKAIPLEGRKPKKKKYNTSGDRLPPAIEKFMFDRGMMSDQLIAQLFEAREAQVEGGTVFSLEEHRKKKDPE